MGPGQAVSPRRLRADPAHEVGSLADPNDLDGMDVMKMEGFYEDSSEGIPRSSKKKYVATETRSEEVVEKVTWDDRVCIFG
ncbi:hypothetical protein V6N12_069253 [Hibiscus sabdariffa]|uniref:Uncharacterized protein n=1 Tax=Hibiscus sabdariffa TaxID=183260 RepID=A0ABR2FDA1_9ROSI